MPVAKILVADTNKNICDFLTFYLGKENFFVKTAPDNEDFFKICKSYNPDLILLAQDYTNVLEVLGDNKVSIPILLLVDKETLSERCFSRFDVIPKPFDIIQTIAKIKMVLKNESCVNIEYAPKKVHFDNLLIDMNIPLLELYGKPVEVDEKAIELLFYLASNPNRIFSREQILDEVFGLEFADNVKTIDDYIKILQTLLQNVSEKWSLKITWGIGYKFELL